VAFAALSAGLAERAGIRPTWTFKLWRARTIRELFTMRSSKALFKAFGYERGFAMSLESLEHSITPSLSLDRSSGGGFFGTFDGNPEFSTLSCGSFGGCSLQVIPPE